MNRLRKPIIEPPQRLFEIEQSVFDELKEGVINLPNRNTMLCWTPDETRTLKLNLPEAERLLITLSEVTQNLCAYSQENIKKQPIYIGYSVDVDDVQPGKSQRVPGWHYDGDDETHITAMVAADCIPTEFVIAKDPNADKDDLIRQYIKSTDSDRSMFSTDAINQGIKDGELEIFHPDERVAVMMTDHVHQSHPNTTNTPIPRTWIRGILRYDD